LRGDEGVIGGFSTDAQAHKEFAKFEPGDKAIRCQTNSLAQLFQCFLRFKVHAKGHAEQHSQSGSLRIRSARFAELLDEFGSLRRFQDIWIAKHTHKLVTQFVGHNAINQVRGCYGVQFNLVFCMDEGMYLHGLISLTTKVRVDKKCSKVGFMHTLLHRQETGHDQATYARSAASIKSGSGLKTNSG
jgi:hypothetical protein